MKPSWGPDGSLLFGASVESAHREPAGQQGVIVNTGLIAAEHRGVRSIKFSNEVRSYRSSVMILALTTA
jgi:hypothetical protein